MRLDPTRYNAMYKAQPTSVVESTSWFFPSQRQLPDARLTFRMGVLYDSNGRVTATCSTDGATCKAKPCSMACIHLEADQKTIEAE